MLFHFSEDPTITRFDPRPSRLNQPVVWAISGAFDFLNLFPRDCPRIVIWGTDQSTTEDTETWLGSDRRAAYVETGWLHRIQTTTIYRYTLPATNFDMLDDVGMAISRQPVKPQKTEALANLPALLKAREVNLRPVPSLDPIKSVWNSTLHASGIRLKNAA